MSGLGMRRRVLAGSVRTANFIIAAVGGTLAGYGAYLATQYSGAVQMWGSMIALGVLDFLFASILLCCGYKSLFVLRLYGMVLGLLEIAEAAIALLFWVPSTRDRIVNAAALPDDLKAQLESHLTVAGIVLLAVVGFQAFTLALVACQCSAVDPLNQGLLDDDEAALLTSSRQKAANARRAGSDKGGADRGPVLSDEEAGAVQAASARYKTGKAAEYYAKYGVR